VNDKERQFDVGQAATKAAEMSWPQTRVILRVIFIVLIVAVTLWIVVKLTGVILLLVLSIFFAYLVSPLVDFLRRPIKLSGRVWEMPRVLAIVVAYVTILAALGVAMWVILPRLGNQFPEFTEQARAYWKELGERMQGIDEYFRLHRMPGPLMDVINRAVPSLVERVSQNLSLFLNAVLAWVIYIPWLILIPILSFFLLKDAETFRRSALQMLPRGRWRWRGDEFFQDVSSTLAAYTRAAAIDPRDADTFANIGWILVKIGRESEGLQALQAAVRLDPTLDTERNYLNARFGRDARQAPTPFGAR